ncbi:MAG: hydantoinase/oxoprolinase N-terminal domain-containing protein, partial [Thermoanaerobaculia bacterium]|nr:hydantoinase/oxoprolinase N-terminal domain-containing protein [Thermoanaerobaculia bacterium]
MWVDTGGTFTDCLAVDPEGNRRRAKVLSSGAVRVRVVEAASSARLRLDPLGDLPAGFLDGAGVVRPGGEPVGRVASLDGATGELTLAEPAARPVTPGEGLEIVSGEPAPVLAARRVTGTPRGEALPELDLRLATTRGTNALLERTGAATALFITRGFGDLLEIGTQQRPELFALQVVKPAPLYRRVVEVDERLDASGEVVEELDLAALAGPIGELRAAGVSCAAVALLHSYVNPGPERRLGQHLRAHGFRHVSCSADLVAEIRLLHRADTAVADAYLGPVVGDYLAEVRPGVGARRFHVLTRAGGLHRAAEFRPRDRLLSGPAGGVVGGAATAGRRRIVAFDM